MEKIYSRKRLKIPKPKKLTKIKLAICLILLGLLFVIIQFIVYVYPIFEETCKNKAQSIGEGITSDEITKVMSNYDYNDLVDIERDPNRRDIYGESKNCSN